MAISSLNKSIGKACGYTVDKWFSKQLEKGYKNPVKYATTMLVTTIVSKDLVGCGFYTTQSWNNKKIPENKRKFIAMTDLMNGLIMVFGQFAIGSIIDKKLTPKLLGKALTGTVENKDTKEIKNISTTKPLSSDNINGVTKEILAEKAVEIETKFGIKAATLNAEELGKKAVKTFGAGSNKYKAIATGFGIFAGALATTAFTKRTLAPLFSTPLASWFKAKYIDKKHKNTAQENAAMKTATIQPKYENPVDKKGPAKGTKTSVVA